MKVCVLIPVFNEEKGIVGVVQGAMKYAKDVVVIDDGSSDKSAKVAEEAGATVIRQEKNKGKGEALKTGFAYTLENGFDACITLDGDGQHSPDSILSFISAAEGEAHILIGRRKGKRENMPVIRMLTNRATSFLISLAALQFIADSQCGYRLIKREVLKKVVLKRPGYELEAELLIKAARRGFIIKNVEIKSIYADETSYINPVRDTLRFFKILLKSLWW